MKINPREIEVFGFESPACIELLISLMIGRMEKDSIPPVKLCTFDNEKTFEIVYDLGGGHHRTLSAFLLGGDCLDIDIVEREFGIPPEIKRTLYNIELETNPVKFRYEKDMMNKNYRELPNTDIFFEKYSKINMALKYGTHADYSLSKEAYEKMISELNKLKQKK